MISCNVLFTVRKGQEKSKIDTYSRPRQIIYETCAAVRAVADDVFTKYECSSFINCKGLTVAPEYESQGIGTEMLRTREELCKLINVPVSATIFTGQMSQRMAARVGY
nr:PREDICTED: uncharacterized protein LOC109036348 [Bemisia tabaci]